MSDSPKKPPQNPSMAEPKFRGVARPAPDVAPGIARHFSQEHDRAAEAARLGGKPGAKIRPAKPAQKP